MSWGAFQHEALVLVGGVASIIAERYDNSLLFTPPDDDVIEEKGCHDDVDAYVVEVCMDQLMI